MDPITTPTFDYTSTEDFNTATLDSRWSWVSPDASHTSLTARASYLRIITQEPQGTNTLTNLLLQNRPAGDFAISTLVDFNPTTNIQSAGLVLYMDDNHYMMLGHAYCGFTPPCVDDGIYFDYAGSSSGSDSENFATPVPAAGPIYLRLTVQGNLFTSYYSLDGTNWSVVGRKSGEADFVPTKIGLAAYNVNLDSTPEEINADFHSFAISQNYLKVFLPSIVSH